MNTSSAAPAHAPASPPAQAANAAQRANGGNAAGQRPTAPDLFATLLALAADGGEATAAIAVDAAVDAAATDEEPPTAPGADHPLASLLMWQPPGLDARRPAAGDAATADGASASARLPSAGTDGPTHAESSAPAPATADAPATPTPPARTAGPSWQVLAARAAQTQPAAQAQGPGAAAGPGAGSAVPAMHWGRAQPAGDSNAWAAVRSTVTLDARFPASSAAAAPPGATGLADTDAPDSGPASIGTAQNAHASGGPAMAGSADPNGTRGEGSDTGDPGAARERDTEAAAPADAYAEALPDEAAVEVQHWGGAHGLRHASLRLGEEAANPIDIQLALRGDEVRLDIRTDDSAVREALREQAQASLGERLQQGGLQLGDVSVGSQQQERPRDGQAPGPAARPLRPGEAAGNEPAPRAPATPRTGNGTLDLFV